MKPEHQFIVVIAFAVLVKQVLSPFHSVWRAVSTALAAVFCAYVFTDPICSILGWGDEKTRLAVAAVLGLTGEHIIRHIIDTGQDPDKGITRIRTVVVKVVDLMTVWRSGSQPPRNEDNERGEK